MFHNSSNYDCQQFFNKLVDEKNYNAKIDIFPKTSEDYISVTYGCIIFIDSYRFLSMGLNELCKTLENEVFNILI